MITPFCLSIYPLFSPPLWLSYSFFFHPLLFLVYRPSFFHSFSFFIFLPVFSALKSLPLSLPSVAFSSISCLFILGHLLVLLRSSNSPLSSIHYSTIDYLPIHYALAMHPHWVFCTALSYKTSLQWRPPLDLLSVFRNTAQPASAHVPRPRLLTVFLVSISPFWFYKYVQWHPLNLVFIAKHCHPSRCHRKMKPVRWKTPLMHALLSCEWVGRTSPCDDMLIRN